jgi:hypothetical protein
MYLLEGGGDIPTPEEEAELGVQIISWLEVNINTILTPVTADTSLLGLSGHSRGGQIAYRMTLTPQVTEKIKALAGVDPVDGLEMFGQTLVITGPLTFDIPTYILGTGLGPIVVGGFLACAPKEIGPFHFYCANPNPTWLAVATTHGHADMIDEADYEEFCPGGPDRDGMRAFTAGTLAAFFSGTLQGNEDALSVLSDPNSSPVPTEMEMNKMGEDIDLDGVCDVCDNCPSHPNGNLGTCVIEEYDMVHSYRVGFPKHFIACTSNDDCADTNGTCWKLQGDFNGNGIGDVCECYYDVNQDGKVSTPDFSVEKWEYGRLNCPSSGGEYDDFLICQPLNQTSCEGASGCVWHESKGRCYTTSCIGDVNKDGRVSTPDFAIEKQEFGRLDCPVVQ